MRQTQEAHQAKILSSSHDLPQKSLQIKQEDKFFSRLLSKESSTANASYRVLYYGGASGAIPFTWESQPGTPKHTFSSTSLPPLTPPPSYHFNSNKKPMQKHSRSNLLSPILARLAMRKTHASPSTSSSISSSSLSSSCSSSYSSPSTLMNPNFHGHCCFLSPRSHLVFGVEDDEQAFGSPTSTSCFGARHETSSGFRGRYSMTNMKNALLSIVGHGSGSGTI